MTAIKARDPLTHPLVATPQSGVDCELSDQEGGKFGTERDNREEISVVAATAAVAVASAGNDCAGAPLAPRRVSPRAVPSGRRSESKRKSETTETFGGDKAERAHGAAPPALPEPIPLNDDNSTVDVVNLAQRTSTTGARRLSEEVTPHDKLSGHLTPLTPVVGAAGADSSAAVDAAPAAAAASAGGGAGGGGGGGADDDCADIDGSIATIEIYSVPACERADAWAAPAARGGVESLPPEAFDNCGQAERAARESVESLPPVVLDQFGKAEGVACSIDAVHSGDPSQQSGTRREGGRVVGSGTDVEGGVKEAASERISRTGWGSAAATPTPVIYVIPEQTPPAVRLVLGQRPGWTEWDANVHGADEWNFQWRSGRFKPSEYRDVREGQRLNHFPRSTLITRKDLLLRVLRKMKAVHGDVYAFHPDSYMLPTEYTKFIDAFTRLQRHHYCTGGGAAAGGGEEAAAASAAEMATATCGLGAAAPPQLAPLSDQWLARPEPSGGDHDDSLPAKATAGRRGAGGVRGLGDAGDGGAMWIVKPRDSSRGRGVYLLRGLEELAYDRPSIVQRYVPNPLTVGGYKADLRLYAVVTSLHPMTVHLYKDGIVRFATSKYKGSPHHDLFGHLTNSSINKRSPFASQEKDVIGGGCKWTLKKLQRWVEKSTANGAEKWSRLWTKIRSLVCLSVLPLADVVPGGAGHGSCFELFGFDIMVDSRLSRPHLIEINCSPALGLDEATDRLVKLPLLADLLDLVDVESACRAEEASRAANRSRARRLPGYCRPLGSSSSCSSPSVGQERRPHRQSDRREELNQQQQKQQQQQRSQQQQRPIQQPQRQNSEQQPQHQRVRQQRPQQRPSKRPELLRTHSTPEQRSPQQQRSQQRRQQTNQRPELLRKNSTPDPMIVRDVPPPTSRTRPTSPVATSASLLLPVRSTTADHDGGGCGRRTKEDGEGAAERSPKLWLAENGTGDTSMRMVLRGSSRSDQWGGGESAASSSKSSPSLRVALNDNSPTSTNTNTNNSDNAYTKANINTNINSTRAHDSKGNNDNWTGSTTPTVTETPMGSPGSACAGCGSGCGFELVFPFNDDSRDHSICLSKNVKAGQARESQVQACVRSIIAAIKAHEKTCLIQLRSSSLRGGVKAGGAVKKTTAPAIATSTAGTRKHGQHTCGHQQVSEPVLETVCERVRKQVFERVCEPVRESVREPVRQPVRQRVCAGDAVCFSVSGKGGGKPPDDALAGTRLSSSAGRAAPMCGEDGGRRHSAGSSAATGLGAPVDAESAALVSLGAGDAGGANGAGGAGGGAGRRHLTRASGDIGDSITLPEQRNSSSSSPSPSSSSFSYSLRRDVNCDDRSSVMASSTNPFGYVTGRTTVVPSTVGSGGQHAGRGGGGGGGGGGVGVGVGNRLDADGAECTCTSETRWAHVENQSEKFHATREQRKINEQQQPWQRKRQQQHQHQHQTYHREEEIGDHKQPPPPRRRLAAARRKRIPNCGIVDVDLSDEHTSLRPPPSASPASSVSPLTKLVSESCKHLRSGASADGRKTEVAETAPPSPTIRTKLENSKHLCARGLASENKQKEAGTERASTKTKRERLKDPRAGGFAGRRKTEESETSPAASPINGTKTETFKYPRARGGVVGGREPGKAGTGARKLAAFWEEERQLVVADGPGKERITAIQGNGCDGVASRPPAADIFLPTRVVLDSAEEGEEEEEEEEEAEGEAKKIKCFATTAKTRSLV